MIPGRNNFAEDTHTGWQLVVWDVSSGAVRFHTSRVFPKDHRPAFIPWFNWGAKGERVVLKDRTTIALKTLGQPSAHFLVEVETEGAGEPFKRYVLGVKTDVAAEP